MADIRLNGEALVADIDRVVAERDEARAEVERLNLTLTQTERDYRSVAAERDDWRRRYEALRDGVTEAVEGSLYVGTSLAATIRAVVARVEGDES